MDSESKLQTPFVHSLLSMKTYILKVKKLQTIRYLLGINKDRGRVLVHQLVAAVGVNMRHFCAVDVQGHLVLINPRFFWVPGRTLNQGPSEKQGGAGGGVSQ